MAKLENRQLFAHWPIAEIVGKTTSGVVIKKNPKGRNPYMQVFLIFNDQTSYELYSGSEFVIDSGLYPWDLEHVRHYISPPLGPMEILLDISLDEKKELVVGVS